MERGRPFVGRGDVLARLHGLLDRAGNRDGRLVLLVGEAGIGKTRLSDELAKAANERGMLVTWGRCWEGEGAAAYWPWLQIVRACAANPRLAGLVKSASEASQELSGLMGAALARAEAPRDSDAEQARFRLFDAVTTLVARASEEVPLVLVLDDLHDADVPSLLLLRFVARALRGTGVLVVGTHRPAEARLRPERSELLAKIAREAEVFPLARLDADAITTWMREGIDAAPAATVNAVVRITEGNPLFVEEMLHVLRERGLDGNLLARGVPDGIREAIGEHLGRLSPAARALLDVASVIGRDFEASEIAVLAHTTTAAVEHALEEAIALRVVFRRDVGFSFAHILLRDQLYEALSSERRRAVHRHLADILRRTKGRERSILARAAHHAFEAADESALEETLALARAAATGAREIFAFEEASSILARAFELMETHGATETRAACEHLIDLGEIRISSGSPELGRAACARAAEIATRIGEPVLLARAALTYGTELLSGRRDETMVSLLRTANAAMNRYRYGDRHAFAELYEAVTPRLLAFVSRRTKDRESARDVVQRVWLRMHLARSRFAHGADVMTWAFAIARRLLIDDFRQSRRRVPLADEEAGWDIVADGDPERLLRVREATTHMRRTLSTIPASQRDAFELLRVGGLAVSDAARRLDTTRGAIKTRAFRAYEALRATLDVVVDA